MALLEVENVVKEFRGGVLANADVSLSVEPGEVYGLLGPNGAGKTTLVSQIIGLLAPTSGRIMISGVDATQDPAYARMACSFQPQSQVPIAGLNPLQAIELVGRLRGGRPAEVEARTRELVAHLELGEWARARGETLSGGIRRLVAFCMATVVPGKLIILDEPTNDVDPLRRRLLWDQVRRVADQGSAVLLVTHNVLEAERSVDRLAIMDRGRMLSQGTPGSMKDETAGFLRLELTLEPKAGPVAAPPFLLHPVNGGRRLLGSVAEGDLAVAVAWAGGLRMSHSVEEFSIGPATLEDAYLRKIGRTEAIDGNGKDGK